LTGFLDLLMQAVDEVLDKLLFGQGALVSNLRLVLR
jgi:hypothetical protein